MSDQIFREDPPTLFGSRDDTTGETYFPPRQYSVDGRLRPCRKVALSREGRLYSFTRMGETLFGQIDLPEKVRLQCRLAPGEAEIGAAYRLEVVTRNDGSIDWRFARA